jgi:two-component system OmpR family sensor kinase
MSIRLRFTLLYNAILMLTLLIFGGALYSVQSHTTFDALKQDMIRTSSTVSDLVLRSPADPGSAMKPVDQQPPKPFDHLPEDQNLRKLPEREIVRILDVNGALVANPFGRTVGNLPLNAASLTALQAQKDLWEPGTYNDLRVLVFSHPVIADGKVIYIVQVARSLDEQERGLRILATTLLVASLLMVLVAFGVGWVFSGLMLNPITRITQTARTIGEERDFTRRVEYNGPQDEVGQLATTFNGMLARLEDAYRQLSHSLEMQRDFVADVSHELRTPLTTLRGNVGLLRRTPPLPAEDRADILSDMTEESDRMIRLVNDLLVLARADAGRSLAREPFALGPVLEECARQARQLDAQRQIEVQAGEFSMVGDRDALKQVLLIALDNALKHSSGAVRVGALRKGALLEVFVKDEGEGIAADKLAHIFDRFYRGEDAATIPGFGLGLPIAKSLVVAMGGEIEMLSEPGQGSTLRMNFPALD